MSPPFSQMLCYDGRHLGSNPHIILLGSSKVGNFVVSTPTINALKNRYPDSIIGFIGSEITADFELAYPSIDWRISWDLSGSESFDIFTNAIINYRNLYGPFDLAINLDAHQ